MLVLAVQVNADQQEVDKRVLGCFNRFTSHGGGYSAAAPRS